MNANEFLRNKSVYRLDSRPSPRVRGSGFARLVTAVKKTPKRKFKAQSASGNLFSTQCNPCRAEHYQQFHELGRHAYYFRV